MTAKSVPMVRTADEAVAAFLAMAATGAYSREWADGAVRTVRATGIVPDWLNAQVPRKWYVKYGGDVSETFADSRDDAINKVRFRMFATTPMNELGDFDAVCPFDVIADAVASVRGVARRKDVESRTEETLFGRRVLTKEEARMRLARMARV